MVLAAKQIEQAKCRDKDYKFSVSAGLIILIKLKAGAEVIFINQSAQTATQGES